MQAMSLSQTVLNWKFFYIYICCFLHLLILTVDVDYSLLTHARELKVVKLPSLERFVQRLQFAKEMKL